MGRNDHLPCERFSQFNDEHPEFGETMPNLLDVPAVGANGISEEMLVSDRRIVLLHNLSQVGGRYQQFSQVDEQAPQCRESFGAHWGAPKAPNRGNRQARMFLPSRTCRTTI